MTDRRHPIRTAALLFFLPAVLVLATCYPDPDELTRGSGSGGSVGSGGAVSSGGATGTGSGSSSGGGMPASGGRSSGGSTTSSGGISGGTAGRPASGGATSSGGSTSGGTAGKSGGGGCPAPAAGGDCNLPACGCPSGQVCYPRSTTMNLGCFVTDNIPEGQACDNKTCASGLGCFGGFCRKYCTTAADCPAIEGASACLQATWSTNNAAIPGVLVCKRVCDPTSPQQPRSPLLACPVGFTCITDKANPGASDCLKSTGSGVTGAACTMTSQCAPGYTCLTSGGCAKYCFKSVGCPAGMGTCTSFGTPSFAGAQEVGVCLQ